tara:strand:+ start:4528 stop:5955 length:1428 start_codon:yes stop_codon:yes gene_type:complete
MSNEACYVTHPLKQFTGNPLLEALRIETDAESLKARVAANVDCEVDVTELPTVYQHALVQELAQIHVPLPQFNAIYKKSAALLLNSYLHRNPMSADSNAIKHTLGELFHGKKEFTSKLPMQRTTAPSVLVHGLSGSGKTTTIRSVLSCFTQVIEHNQYQNKMYKQTQLVWISFDLPATPSIKALALNFFQAVDDAVKTNYYNIWQKNNRLSVDQHLNAVRLIAETHALGLVHIDELQFMLTYAKSKDSPTLTVLEALFNKLGIPMLLSCTSEGVELLRPQTNNGSTLTPNITTTRRMCNDREFRFDLHKLNSVYFSELFNGLFPWGIREFNNFERDLFKETFHHLSCGLPAVMTRLAQLYYELKFDLMEKNTGNKLFNDVQLEIKLLRSVYKNQFSLIASALKMLRSGMYQSYEAAVRGSESASSSFSNKEQKQAKAMERAALPAVIKNESDIRETDGSSFEVEKEIETGFGGTR